MNFGPLEFADYLRRKDDGLAGEPATVRAARAAAPASPPLDARLTLTGTSRCLPPGSEGRAGAREVAADLEL